MDKTGWLFAVSISMTQTITCFCMAFYLFRTANYVFSNADFLLPSVPRYPMYEMINLGYALIGLGVLSLFMWSVFVYEYKKNA